MSRGPWPRPGVDVDIQLASVSWGGYLTKNKMGGARATQESGRESRRACDNIEVQSLNAIEMCVAARMTGAAHPPALHAAPFRLRHIANILK